MQSAPYNSADLDFRFRDYYVVVEPIDWSKAKTFRKWEYDPSTIARDVLSSIGSPLADSGLNHHLQPLLKNFSHVDENLDLAAIRWDLVGA